MQLSKKEIYLVIEIGYYTLFSMVFFLPRLITSRHALDDLTNWVGTTIGIVVFSVLFFTFSHAIFAAVRKETVALDERETAIELRAFRLAYILYSVFAPAHVALTLSPFGNERGNIVLFALLAVLAISAAKSLYAFVLHRTV
jgi:hypothetical protein